jgi:predicted MFS family arabinose efflux permease
MRDYKVVLLSLVAMFFVVLTFTVNWMFIALAVIFSGWGWKILIGKDKE